MAAALQQLQEQQRRELAEQWGFERLGAPLPDGTSLTVLAQSIPPELERLDAAHNAIEALDGLEGLARLRTLDLSCNRLSSVDAVAPLRRWTPALISLGLAGNPLCRGKAHRAVVIRRPEPPEGFPKCLPNT